MAKGVWAVPLLVDPPASTPNNNLAVSARGIKQQSPTFGGLVPALQARKRHYIPVPPECISVACGPCYACSIMRLYVSALRISFAYAISPTVLQLHLDFRYITMLLSHCG